MRSTRSNLNVEHCALPERTTKKKKKKDLLGATVRTEEDIETAPSTFTRLCESGDPFRDSRIRKMAEEDMEKALKSLKLRQNWLKTTDIQDVEAFLDKAKVLFRGRTGIPYASLVEPVVLKEIARWAETPIEALTDDTVLTILKQVVELKYNKEKERSEIIEEKVHWRKDVNPTLALKSFFGRVLEIYPDDSLERQCMLKKMDVLKILIRKLPVELRLKKNLYQDMYGSTTSGLISLKTLQALAQKRIDEGCMADVELDTSSSGNEKDIKKNCRRRCF